MSLVRSDIDRSGLGLECIVQLTRGIPRSDHSSIIDHLLWYPNDARISYRRRGIRLHIEVELTWAISLSPSNTITLQRTTAPDIHMGHILSQSRWSAHEYGWIRSIGIDLCYPYVIWGNSWNNSWYGSMKSYPIDYSSSNHYYEDDKKKR